MGDVVYRPPRDEDIPQLVALERDWSRRHGLPATESETDIRHTWSGPDYDRERHELVADLDGAIVGKANSRVSRSTLEAWGQGYVPPEYCGLGVGSRLLDWVIDTARTDHDGQGTVLRTACLVQETDAEELIASRGFSYERTFFEMRHPAPAGSAEPEWPAGIALRNDLRGDELVDTFRAAYDGSFVDHWNFHPMARDAAEQSLSHPDVDPSLMWFAFGADGSIAGHAALYTERDGNEVTGFVWQLGTTRPFRGIGLGRALLRHSLLRLADSGSKAVQLGVDAENPSGALPFYERAGFSVLLETRTYTLPLRDDGGSNV